MSAERIAMIRARLTEVFAPDALNIIDESAKHAGHASAGGAGHFVVEIVSDAFQDKSPIQRHRLVYKALEDTMHTEIHALSIKASTPAEAGT
ncbi:MAG TPA: BolA family transcriptional regulator [Gammaproteobacteria bacterium]|nr:BolA family transcriptional regulator [Gammaproteobacteria bacterium]